MSNPSRKDEAATSSAIVETVRVSRSARDQLVTLKRRTGIENWNVLCRWALCVSLAESTQPRDLTAVSEAVVEMTWRTFTGGDELSYAALVRQRCKNDRLPDTPEVHAEQLRLHLHRGISYLVGSPTLTDIVGLLRLTTHGKE